ncbi:MAG TPA: hypothetical protein VF174_09925 [Micromonosporaceae bacterium]
MTITAAGWYGPTLRKALVAAPLPSNGLDSDTAVKVLLVTDQYTPDYSSHEFRDDISGEIPEGGGYSAGGLLLPATTTTVAGGVLTWDAGDVQWTGTISNAMGAVCYFARGGAASADELILLADFVNPVSTINGPLEVQWSASGVGYIDFTP